MSLRLPDSGAEVLADGRRVPPSALRNAEAPPDADAARLLPRDAALSEPLKHD